MVKGTARKKQDHGLVGLKDLLDTLEYHWLQTSDRPRKTIKRSHTVLHLKRRLAQLAGQRVSCFGYLTASVLGPMPTAEWFHEQDVKLTKEYGMCLMSPRPHHQMRIQTSKGRAGRFKIQASALQAVLVNNPSSHDELVEQVKGLIDRETTTFHSSHLCKGDGSCMELKHTLRVPAQTNLADHELCPAFVVIYGNLVNLCTCSANEGRQCLVPGRRFNFANWARVYAPLMTTFLKPKAGTGIVNK
uniref:Homing endonuclease n=1 Tax=Didymium iridis TaxID=5793 RepID=Q53I49_9MYCE|nr:homing endonuclease [Didymium iridis]